MIAFLGMYDMPALQTDNDTFWDAIRTELGHGPATLTRTDDPWPIWQSPDLLMAQTCGYPYRARLHDQVHLIGTPDYGLPDCPPGHYRSVFIKRREDPRGDLHAFAGATFAYNEGLSQSGWAAPVTQMLAAGATPGALVQTGGHANSLSAVVEGRADYAALDALTWELLQKTDMEVSEAAAAFDMTPPSPGLPYITGPKGDPGALAAAIQTAIAGLSGETRQALHLRDLVQIPADHYLAVPNPPTPLELAETYKVSVPFSL